MTKQAGRGGFTLVELLIYIGVFSITAGLLTGVLVTFTRVQVRENATVEVSQQAEFVVQTVQRLIRDSSIVELAKDAPTSTLKLRMKIADDDPTCVDLSGGVARIMEGNDGVDKQKCKIAAALPLTDSKVIVNTLTFTKFENPPARDTVQIDITVSFNSTNPQESAISRTLRSAITKVSAATFDSDIVPGTDATHSVGIGAQRWSTGFFSGNVTVGGNVGIGTTVPATILHLFGSAPIISLENSASGGKQFRLRNGVVATSSLDIFDSASSTSRLEINSSGTVIIGGGTGKINAGTIDPIYNIGGTRYATYLPGMTGTVREEAVGTVTLRSREAVIDFDELARGDALWVFYQITDFGPRWDNLVIQLTPNTNGTVWYEKDVLRNRLIIKGEKGGEISYRLSAPRFDHEKWGNVSDAQTGGFEITEK